MRDDEAGLPENMMISHQMAIEPKIDLDAIANAEEEKAPPPPQPAVTTIVPSTPAPPPAPEPVQAAPVAAVAAIAAPQFGPRDNVFVRFWRWLVGDKRAPAPEPIAAGGEPRRERDGRRDGRPGVRGERSEHRRDGRREERRAPAASRRTSS